MRKQEKIIVWPAYLDSLRTRREGRRVPKTLAVAVPRALEVKDAAESAGLKSELVPDLGYPPTPWQKTGMVLVDKKGTKNATVIIIAKQLLKTRSVAKTEGT